MFFAQGASPSVMQNCEKVHVERIENLLVNQNYDLKPTEMEKWDSSHWHPWLLDQALDLLPAKRS